jgi:hypothetical protein
MNATKFPATFPTVATLKSELPEGGHRYRLFMILPKRDFGTGSGWLIKGKWVKEGWVVTDTAGLCNAMPAAAWFQTLDEARHAIDVWIAVKGDAEMFWDVLHPFQHTPGQRDPEHTPPATGKTTSYGRHYAKYDGDVCVEVGILDKEIYA